MWIFEKVFAMVASAAFLFFTLVSWLPIPAPYSSHPFPSNDKNDHSRNGSNINEHRLKF
jgi:hypothetical protein